MRIVRKITQRVKKKMIFLWDGVNNKKFTKKYVKFLRKIGVEIEGSPDYISSTAYLDGYNYSNIHIGDKTVISKDVMILTHDFSIRTGLLVDSKWDDVKNCHFEKKVYIGNNVFIGARSVILPGTIIDDNVIIGAGTVVRGKIESNSVYIGNPAKKIVNLDEWTKNHTENSFIDKEIF